MKKKSLAEQMQQLLSRDSPAGLGQVFQIENAVRTLALSRTPEDREALFDELCELAVQAYAGQDLRDDDSLRENAATPALLRFLLVSFARYSIATAEPSSAVKNPSNRTNQRNARLAAAFGVTATRKKPSESRDGFDVAASVPLDVRMRVCSIFGAALATAIEAGRDGGRPSPRIEDHRWKEAIATARKAVFLRENGTEFDEYNETHRSRMKVIRAITLKDYLPVQDDRRRGSSRTKKRSP